MALYWELRTATLSLQDNHCLLLWSARDSSNGIVNWWLWISESDAFPIQILYAVFEFWWQLKCKYDSIFSPIFWPPRWHVLESAQQLVIKNKSVTSINIRFSFPPREQRRNLTTCVLFHQRWPCMVGHFEARHEQKASLNGETPVHLLARKWKNTDAHQRGVSLPSFQKSSTKSSQRAGAKGHGVCEKRPSKVAQRLGKAKCPAHTHALAFPA